jgi:hypothetical protein
VCHVDQMQISKYMSTSSTATSLVCDFVIVRDEKG